MPEHVYGDWYPWNYSAPGYRHPLGGYPPRGFGSPQFGGEGEYHGGIGTSHRSIHRFAGAPRGGRGGWGGRDGGGGVRGRRGYSGRRFPSFGRGGRR